MAKTQAQLADMTKRRTEVIAGNMKTVIEAWSCPETGAGLVLAADTYGEHTQRAYFFRPRTLKRAFREEIVTTAHERMRMRQRLADLLAAEKAAKVAPHDLKPGEIIVDCWGWTMRDARFFKVTGVPDPRKVEVVQIEREFVSGNSMAGSVKPRDSHQVIGEPLVYDVSMESGVPALKTGSSISRMGRWGGQPVQIYSD